MCQNRDTISRLLEPSHRRADKARNCSELTRLEDHWREQRLLCKTGCYCQSLNTGPQSPQPQLLLLPFLSLSLSLFISIPVPLSIYLSRARALSLYLNLYLSIYSRANNNPQRDRRKNYNPKKKKKNAVPFSEYKIAAQSDTSHASNAVTADILPVSQVKSCLEALALGRIRHTTKEATERGTSDSFMTSYLHNDVITKMNHLFIYGHIVIKVKMTS